METLLGDFPPFSPIAYIFESHYRRQHYFVSLEVKENSFVDVSALVISY